MKQLINPIRNFASDEDGAQVLEYALIIAVVSLAMVIALSTLNGNFGTFITRLVNCLTTPACV
jgi:pilus assembly protein Flp/PilA